MKTLTRGDPVVAESFDSVTLFFSDIAGFSDFTLSHTPEDVVELLNTVYSTMDCIISQYNVYKVKDFRSRKKS